MDPIAEITSGCYAWMTWRPGGGHPRTNRLTSHDQGRVYVPLGATEYEGPPTTMEVTIDVPAPGWVGRGPREDAKHDDDDAM